MDQETEVRRGTQARELLEHPLLVEAFAAIRDTINTQWLDSPARDMEGREKLWVMLKLLGSLEGHLKETLETGKLAQIQVNEKQSAMETAKRWVGMS